jgi:WXXGXW repeat (2 copies)
MRHISTSVLVRSACALALGLSVLALPELVLAQVSVSITLAPPPLPVYEQPLLVEEGGIWAPGYWDYGPGGYFWVPGTWVQPPAVGLLWTPGYWGWNDGTYSWNAGYWGAEVGFYGGVNYGFGYFGRGYAGGHWQNQRFYYNTAVSHVNVTNIHNVYNQTVVNNTTVNRVSYNGGAGGITVRPTAVEQSAARAPHQAATPAQSEHRQAALSNRALFASVNHGKPETAATAKPAELGDRRGVKAAEARSPNVVPQKVAAPPSARSAPVHASDLPAVAHQTAPSTGNAERDKVNQKQQDTLRADQGQQRQELQRKQAQDHEQALKQPAARAGAEELERQHQAQTKELGDRHATEQKNLRETQASKQGERREGPSG